MKKKTFVALRLQRVSVWAPTNPDEGDKLLHGQAPFTLAANGGSLDTEKLSHTTVSTDNAHRFSVRRA